MPMPLQSPVTRLGEVVHFYYSGVSRLCKSDQFDTTLEERLSSVRMSRSFVDTFFFFPYLPECALMNIHLYLYLQIRYMGMLKLTGNSSCLKPLRCAAESSLHELQHLFNYL